MGSIQNQNHNAQNHINKNKYSTTIQHIPILFSSSANLQLDNLHDFVSKGITETVSSNKNLQEQLVQVLHSDNSNALPTELLNSTFTEFMWLIVPLLNKYATDSPKHDSSPFTQHNNNTNNDCTLSSQTTPHNEEQPHSYVFKEPKKDTVFAKHWRQHFQELELFKQQFGHCNVSRTTKGHDQLGNWLADQRRKLRRGKMTRQQYEMLTQLGMMFITHDNLL